jgi:hypothetical protein
LEKKTMSHFTDEAELSALVRGFETCTIHPAEFKHYQHLAVALWYIAHFPYEEASDKMRTGIQKLAAAYGKTGYHETITIFWVQMVRRFFVESTAAHESIVSLANSLAAKFADKNLINDYYSAELLASAEAKTKWVEPDLRPLEVAEEKSNK